MTTIVDGSNGVSYPLGGATQTTGMGPAFSATLSTNQSISSTTSKIQFNTKDFDTNNNYDAVTNYRFTPTVAGYYQVNLITTSSNSAGSGSGTFIYVYKNGVAYRGQGSDAPGAGYNQALSVCCVMPFNGTTDYIEAYLRTGGSVTLYTTLNATNASSFSAALVRGL
jgi:hypothetical protein